MATQSKLSSRLVQIFVQEVVRFTCWDTFSLLINAPTSSSPLWQPPMNPSSISPLSRLCEGPDSRRTAIPPPGRDQDEWRGRATRREVNDQWGAERRVRERVGRKTAVTDRNKKKKIKWRPRGCLASYSKERRGHKAKAPACRKSLFNYLLIIY